MAPSDRITLEIALESLADARVAAAAEADRFELCAALDVGGLTPSSGTLAAIREEMGLPIFAMIRPRPGGFVYSDDEIAVMRRDIELLLASGAAGVVFGVLDEKRQVDRDCCAALLESCGGRPAVFHRAFDLTPDPHSALDALIELGFRRLLTSGHQRSCVFEAAKRQIAELVRHAADRIEIMPGSGVRADSVAELVQKTGCRQVHGAFRAQVSDCGLTPIAVDFGFGIPGKHDRVAATNGELIRATRFVLDGLSNKQPRLVLAFVADLIFQSKIAGTAAQLGVPVQCVRTVEQCRRNLGLATTLMVDMTVSEPGLLDFLAEAVRTNPQLITIAFFPHVESGIARAARDAGVSKVLTRSQFSEQLPELLKVAGAKS